MKQVKMPFDGNVIETVTGEDGKPWISVRSVCQAKTPPVPKSKVPTLRAVSS